MIHIFTYRQHAEFEQMLRIEVAQYTKIKETRGGIYDGGRIVSQEMS